MSIKEQLGETPILMEEAGGWLRYLDGEPIHAGDVLEYFDAGQGSWLAARFETVPGTRGRAAVLALPDNTSVAVAATTRLRWLAK
jgi:hypothetical protein